LKRIGAERNRPIARKLLVWFSQNRRDFPWRKTFERPDPYVVLFTEIMLQRTKAEQVVPVYTEFFERFPNFKKLAEGPESEVVSLFSKLGLRWRAQNVIKLIHELSQRYAGKVPDNLAELKGLPAVGDYVAAAVACYAFGEIIAPIDSNVVRVIARLFGMSVKEDAARRNRNFSEVVESLIPRSEARNFNLALLDLGALVCKTRPLCSHCPLVANCEYFRSSQDKAMSGITSRLTP
jgi:A/G-specific adenine glycosylase